MKQSRSSTGWLLSVLLVTTVLLSCHDTGSAKGARGQSETSAKAAGPPQQLSAEGQASLRAITQAGKFSDLRWPDFSDYQTAVQKFYDSYGGALPWVRGMQPTPQAQQFIASFLTADQKGLSADDYDGPRWSDRLAKLKPAASNPSEADAVRFDAALTVCVMR
jgi:hypothetical protein